MNYLSVCSGIEAATQAWHPLSWKPVAFSEIEKFPCAVLKHHYPDAPNWGDMTKFKEWPDAEVDVLVGGTPCQSFSVAGLRKGLEDPRGNLMLTYLAIAERYTPKWVAWENVPGVMSSNGGKDFGTFLGAMGELGYGFAYRVLDAQFVRTDGYPYAVPQRRRRVFVVGCIGDWRSAAAVLFDSESLRGNPPPRREAGQAVARDVANCIRASGGGTERIGDTRGQDPVVAVAGISSGSNPDVMSTLCATDGTKWGCNQWVQEGKAILGPKNNCNHEQPIVFDEAQITSKTNMSRVEPGLPCGTLNQKGKMTIALAGNTIGREPKNGGNHTGFDESGASYTLTKTDVHAVAYPINTQIATRHKAFGVGEKPDVAHCLRSGASKADKHESTAYIAQTMQVRRLTPTECARLQGFPDDYLPQVPGYSDSAAYKSLGNSMAVNVMAVIGERIQMVENLSPPKESV